MTKRFALIAVVLGILGFGARVNLVAHEGHDHKVMGTVTMAMADHVMLKDTAGKDVTVHVNKDTKVKAKPAIKVTEIKPGTRVVITGEMEKDQLIAKTIEVGAVAATK